MTDPHASSDTTLVAAMQRGDRGAFETAITQYYQELLAYLTYHTKSEGIAEDLLQDLFLRLWRSHATLVVTHGLRAYLYAAARNQFQNHLRSVTRQARTAHAYEHDATSPLYYKDDAHTFDRDELATALTGAIKALPDRAREVWQLHHERGLTYTEVAEVLGISVNTVKSQMGRAVGLLRERLKPLLGLAVLMLR